MKATHTTHSGTLLVALICSSCNTAPAKPAAPGAAAASDNVPACRAARAYSVVLTIADRLRESWFPAAQVGASEAFILHNDSTATPTFCELLHTRRKVEALEQHAGTKIRLQQQQAHCHSVLTGTKPLSQLYSTILDQSRSSIASCGA